MATVIGDRDVLLLGSSQRALNPPNSGILLTTSAPAFKVDTSGNPLPSSITIKASLIGISGFVNFTATGATVTDHGDNTATLAFSSLTGASCTVTANITVNGQAFTSSTTLAKVTDGSSGTSGTSGNQYATVYMYQWAANQPALPNGTTGYTWATGVNSTYSGTDNWSLSATNPSSPGLKLYVATAQITAPGGTASTTVSYSTATIQVWSANGTNGVSGVQSTTVQVYRWDSSTAPAAPAGSPTYIWSGASAGTFGAAPTGWVLSPGTAPSQGMTLWAARVRVTDSATNSSTVFNWSDSAIIAVGSSGSNGGAGPSGASYVTAYCASSTGTTSTAPAQTTGKTSLPATNDGGITGTWAATVPTLSVGQYLYQSDGIYDPQTNKVTWSIPYWSSLKVGSLSAITVNTGNLTISDTISDAAGNWSIDSNGHMTAKSFDLKDSAGNTFLSAGVPLPASHFGGTLGGDNLLNNSGFENVNNSTPNRPNGYIMYNNGNVSAAHIYAPGRLGGRAFAIRALATTSDTFGLRTNTDIIESDGTVGGVRGGWQPNKTYVVSFKARKVNGANMRAIALRWNYGPAVFTSISNPVLSTNWQTYSFRITWGGVAQYIESAGQLYIDCNWVESGASVAANDEFHIDELLVQEGDVYSEWFPSAVEAKTLALNSPAATFTPHLTWDFTGSAQSWVGANLTVTANTDYVTVAATNGDPMFTTSANFSGSKYNKIRVRFRRTAGSAWDGTLFYGNGNHGDDGSYLKSIADPTVGQGSNWVVAEWDMAASLNPSDWASGSITRLRIDLGASSSDVFDIDWISVGRYGVGSDEPSKDIVLVSRGNITLTGNTATKSSGTGAWDSDVYSRDSYTGGAYASAMLVDTTSRCMFGLNDDPTTDSSYGSLNYAIYFENLSGQFYVFENGTSRGAFGTWAAGDIFMVLYDGSSVKYLRNGTVFYTSQAASASTPNQTLFFDSSFFDIGSTFKNIRFGPLSSNNWTNVGGANKPQDNATVGAPAGTNVGSTPAQTVESNAAAGKSASDAIPGINAAISDKLSKTSAGSLAATITLATGGSILSGTTTNGTYQNPSGFYGVQGGVVKFSVPISGDPTFAGQLTAAYGSFGTVTIASGGYVASGQTAYNTGNGFFLGYSGSTPVFSLGNANGTGIRWDGSSLTIQNANVSSSFAATVTNTVNSTYWPVPKATTNSFAGSYTANPTGGSGNYTYAWTVSSSGREQGWIGQSNTQQVSLSVSGTNVTRSIDYYLQCIVTDTTSKISVTVGITTTVDFQ